MTAVGVYGLFVKKKRANQKSFFCWLQVTWLPRCASCCSWRKSALRGTLDGEMMSTWTNESICNNKVTKLLEHILVPATCEQAGLSFCCFFCHDVYYTSLLAKVCPSLLFVSINLKVMSQPLKDLSLVINRLKESNLSRHLLKQDQPGICSGALSFGKDVRFGSSQGV